ncbi:MAG: hypothetical protein U0892_02525 [Pirellulales bacterium]
MRKRSLSAAIATALFFAVIGPYVSAQREIGFIERFATSADRRAVLQELIPATEDYFYYHCLHYQNERQLAQAASILEQWRAKFGETNLVTRMHARQMLLSYDANPQQTLDYLRNHLGVYLDHAPPNRDRAAALASSLDNAPYEPKQLLAQGLAADRLLSQIETRVLPQLVDMQFAPDQLRTWLQRLDRADFDGLVKRVAEELALKDSPGFGWANVHRQLSLDQLKDLLKLYPRVIEQDNFVRAYADRLVPPEGASLEDPTELRAYLDRLTAFVRTLPPSQNSFRAYAIGNLLKLNLSEGKFDKTLFLEYLALPRSLPYYNLERFRNQPVPMADLNYSLAAGIVGAVGDDSEMVRRYLEHFLQQDENIDAFARLLDRKYVERVLAETKILYGIGEAATWYAKLTPEEQKSLKDRIELRYLPTNGKFYGADATPKLDVEVKHVDELIIKIYEINPRNYFRIHKQPINTSIDLDGLVANAERKVIYSQPADRRHVESIDLPELAGRGVWVVDLLGGGQRSRALIHKGNLNSVQQLTDAGHVFRIFDETGAPVPTAAIEINSRRFDPDSKGEIFVPYIEQDLMQTILLVDGNFASLESIRHQSESFALTSSFVIDRQSLIAGSQAQVLIRPRLTCNSRPTSIRVLEEPKLTITAVDSDGLSTSQTVTDLELKDTQELEHRFLVPQRLTQLTLTISGRVYNQSRDVREPLSFSEVIICNAINGTDQIGAFFLKETPEGYQLSVLGRNGEPVSRLPVTLAMKSDIITPMLNATLATDAEGNIKLGALVAINSITANAQGLQSATFQPERFHRMWPNVIHAPRNSVVTLPLGKESATASDFSVSEIRRDLNYRVVKEGVEVADGALTIRGLTAGDYVLRDFESGQAVRIEVIDTDKAADGGALIGKHRAAEQRHRAPLVIRDARIEGDQLKVKVDGADEFTHLTVVANVFAAERSHAEQLEFPYPPMLMHARRHSPNFYIDSLKLDEEYSYILDRRNRAKYAGNLLPQPSLLIHPWELSKTDNAAKDAAMGDMVPPAAAPAPMAAEAMDPRMKAAKQAAAVSPCFDFLAAGTTIAANIPVGKDGTVSIPAKGLEGYSKLEVVAVHPTTVDSRTVVLPSTQPKLRDQRLKSAFKEDVHLAEKQSVRILNAGEKTELGDARTSRAQIYMTLSDVYRLYGTILGNPEWEKFRFITTWNKLSDDQKQARYSEFSCHELDMFLFNKDRKFFDSVVVPILSQKQDKQLVDLWLLGQSIDAYKELWRVRKLNTLERVLLSAKVEEQKSGTARWLDEFLAANPLDPQQRSQRFEVALRGSLLDGSSESGYLDLMGRTEAGPRGEMLEESLNAAQSRFGTPSMGGFAGGAQDFGGLGGMGGGGMGGGMGSGAGGMPGRPEDAVALSKSMAESRDAPGAPAGPGGAANRPQGMGGRGAKPQVERQRNLRRSADKDEKAKADGQANGADRFYFDSRKLAESKDRADQLRFFQSLDATRQWAESQYHHVRLNDQTPSLVPPSAFWKEVLAQDGKSGFLSQNIDLPVNSVNEALLALAVIDLPWESEAAAMAVENDRLTVTAKQPAIAYVQSIEPAAAADAPASILVGQDIYLAQPSANEDADRPVQDKPLLIGTPYRTSVVVTNPTSTQKRVQVLHQLPAGAIPLSGSRITKSSPVELAPYSTAQVQYSFYFPAAGEFAHYGAQISADTKHLIAASSAKLRVLAEPESVDETTWAYIADWGSNEKVLEYLGKANLQRIDLTRIAFRMQDKAFYSQVIDLLGKSGLYVPELWAYSIRHNVPQDMEQFLQHRPDFISLLGPVFDSSLLVLDPQEQMSYEHLDYKPLVVGRIHQLGSTRVILNDSLHGQYSHLLEVISFQSQPRDAQRMELCYYLLLQNRIEESLAWYVQVSSDKLTTKVQYDYFTAYLDFFRGKYDEAGEIALRYKSYPVPRWRDLFSQVTDQLQQRQALLEGREMTTVVSLDSGNEREDRMLTDKREAQQNRQAAEAPALDFTLQDGAPVLSYRNLDEIQVNYYLMDIELLFSRNPFVGQGGSQLPTIQPNLSRTVKVGKGAETKQLELPAEVRNRNVLIEVTSRGISRSQVLTANTLSVSTSEAYGRLQVTGRATRGPIEAAYVKVYARHHDGSIRFFKDGYTDLRGQFDYVSLSTPDLTTTERFSILILHPEHGAMVKEASPPTR